MVILSGISITLPNVTTILSYIELVSYGPPGVSIIGISCHMRRKPEVLSSPPWEVLSHVACPADYSSDLLDSAVLSRVFLLTIQSLLSIFLNTKIILFQSTVFISQSFLSAILMNHSSCLLDWSSRSPCWIYSHLLTTSVETR